MALSKADVNNINVTAAASKAIKWNSAADGFETGDLSGNTVLLSTATASSSATLDFTSGIDSTYKEYVFKFINIHPATDRAFLQFQVDTGTNTNYNQAITSTYFHFYHDEADTATGLAYVASKDLAQGTGFQTISYNTSNDNDACSVGTLHLYDPSNTTFVKHFIAEFSSHDDGYSDNPFAVGYINTTTAITRIQFKFSGGNIASGVIKMYGIT
jgi:hypothetical protein